MRLRFCKISGLFGQPAQPILAVLEWLRLIGGVQFLNSLLELPCGQWILLLFQEANAEIDEDLCFEANVLRGLLQQRYRQSMLVGLHESLGKFMFQLHVVRVVACSAAIDFDFLIEHFFGKINPILPSHGIIWCCRGCLLREQKVLANHRQFDIFHLFANTDVATDVKRLLQRQCGLFQISVTFVVVRQLQVVCDIGRILLDGSQ